MNEPTPRPRSSSMTPPPLDLSEEAARSRHPTARTRVMSDPSNPSRDPEPIQEVIVDYSGDVVVSPHRYAYANVGVGPEHEQVGTVFAPESTPRLEITAVLRRALSQPRLPEGMTAKRLREIAGHLAVAAVHLRECQPDAEASILFGLVEAAAGWADEIDSVVYGDGTHDAAPSLAGTSSRGPGVDDRKASSTSRPGNRDGLHRPAPGPSTERVPWWEALASKLPVHWPGVGDPRPIDRIEHELGDLVAVSAGPRYKMSLDSEVHCPGGTVEVLIEQPEPDVVQRVADAILYAAAKGFRQGPGWRPEAEAAMAAYREALGCGDDDDVLVILDRHLAIEIAAGAMGHGREIRVRVAARAALEREER